MREMHFGADFEGKFEGSSYMRDRLVCEYIRYLLVIERTCHTKWIEVVAFIGSLNSAVDSLVRLSVLSTISN